MARENQTAVAVALAGLAMAAGLMHEIGPYPDGSVMRVALAGSAGDAVRVTIVPRRASTDF